MPDSMSALRAARIHSTLPPVLAALAIVGCGGTEPAPGKTIDISPAMRSSCPEHPFKPEFQVASALRAGGPAAEKSAAAAISGDPFQVEVYDDDGDLVVEWSGIITPTVPGSIRSMQWAGTDSQGRPVPSGYYFLRSRVEHEGGQTETSTYCRFYVNPDDSDKLK